MRKYGILALIVLAAAAIRIYKLDVRPAGFTWDEAALGYNAYSLLKTGRDEYGTILPIVLKSFGDFKPGLYTYFAVPPTAIGGLNKFTTRLPAAVFGVITIVLIFVLTKNLWAGLILAINPWALQFSRGAWEANVSLTLTLLGSILFVRKKYFWAALFLGLTLWTYQGAKLFTPLIIVSLLVIYRTELTKLVKPLLLLLLLLLPIIWGFGTQSGRLKVFSVFSYTRSKIDVTEILRQDGSSKPNLIYYLYHSELLDQSRGIMGRYLNHFSPYYLFFAGDWTNLRQTIPYYGYFHVIEMLTLALGLIWIIKNSSPLTKLLVAWMFLAPVPAALSRDLVSGVRSLPLIVPLVIFSGIGMEKLFKKKIINGVLLMLLVFLEIYFLDLYFIHAPKFTAADWLYPYQPAMKEVAENYNQYQKIIFSPKLGQPYIFALYFLKVDPREYQAQATLTANSQGDVGRVEKFGKFEFRNIYWPEDRKLTNTLFVGDQYELPEQDLDATVIKLSEIVYPNGAPALKVVGTL